MTHTVGEILRTGTRVLEHRSDSPRLDAEVLLGSVLGLSRSGLIARSAEPVALELERAYSDLIDKRLGGAPIAYLTGIREFWSLTLKVSPAVLVPRPETEVLVELALQKLPRDSASTVLDLGTGSGAIALCIASERPFSRVTGVDISEPALKIARQNARDLELSNIDWRLGSWFAPVQGARFDMIVANPPYIAAADPALADLRAEPAIALSAGATGLEALSAVAAGAAAHLRPGGWLLMEHGADQAAQVARLLVQHGFNGIRSQPDLSGKPRVMLGTHSPT